MKKKKLNQTQALAMWMKSGEWITGRIAYNELGITRLPEIFRRLKFECRYQFWNQYVFETEIQIIKTRYGKTHITKQRVRPEMKSPFKHFVKEFCK